MTAQHREKLRYNGEIYHLAVEPLYPYIKKKKIIFVPHTTACWRGYYGSWSIDDGKLYLTDLIAYAPKQPDEQTDPRRALFSSEKVGLEYLFPEQDKVFAKWFSGELRIPYGKMLRYVHQGYASIYEKELFLKIKKGKLVSSYVIDNKKRLEKEKDFEEMELEGICEYIFGCKPKKQDSWFRSFFDKVKNLFSHRELADEPKSNNSSTTPITKEEQQNEREQDVRKERLLDILICLDFLHNNPDAMETLNKILWRNASTYSSSLGCEVSIYNHLPKKFFIADELFSKIEGWEVFKKEWYKALSSKYPESWIPIADFQSENDELFVDISVKHLPIIVAKFWGKDDFRHKEICDSLIGFVNASINAHHSKNAN